MQPAGVQGKKQGWPVCIRPTLTGEKPSTSFSGAITASAMVAWLGDATQFKNGREMAAYVGLVPRQHSSGGKQQLGGHISKRGDSYLRTLVIHGARSVLKTCAGKEDRRSQWLQSVAERRNRNIATVALANKNVRIAWAILSRGEDYHGKQVAG